MSANTPLLEHGEKTMALVPQPEPMLAMIERLAVDPAADVEKLERLVQLHERQIARQAEIAFNLAMNAAQSEMRTIGVDASNPQTKSKYASYEKLDKALRPIYTAHGFGLSFDTTDSALAEHVRVLCYVTHAAGHARTYRCDMPADGKGAKGGDVMTKTHAAGSAMSYGMRYLLKMIFNVAVGESDDDGNQAAGESAKPDGFFHWLEDMRSASLEGVKALEKAWGNAPKEFKAAILVVDWEGMKRAAKAADEAAKAVK